MKQPEKITFGEMCEMSVRGVLILVLGLRMQSLGSDRCGSMARPPQAVSR